MKASHLKTPRTMTECEWHSWGQAIWIDEDHYNKSDRFVMLVSVFAITLTVIGCLIL